VIFHPFFADMARTHRVIYVDLYGRGRSDRPADLADVTFAGDVADIADLIGVLGLGPELARQDPDTWDRITALRSAGRRSTDPEVAAELAMAARLVRFYHPDHASLLATEPGARNLELYPVFALVREFTAQ
jgi:hypothetical protein